MGNINYNALVPQGGVDIDVYEGAVDFAFSNKDVHNIAISGAYGSGKSSILKTYELRNLEEKKLLHIC